MNIITQNEWIFIFACSYENFSIIEFCGQLPRIAKQISPLKSNYDVLKKFITTTTILRLCIRIF